MAHTEAGGFIFLISWRIARRFGRRDLAVVVLIAPVFAVSAAYVILGALGHVMMRLVAGPATADQLARRPWEQTASSP